MRNGQIQFYDNGYREGAVDYSGELDFNVDDTKTMEFKPSFRSVTIQMPYSKGRKPDVIIAYNSSKDAPVLPKSEYTVTYNKPITGVGDYKIIIKFKNGYKGTLTQNLRVIPMYPDVISVKAGKKKMDLKWRYYNKEADGCQIQYSQDKNLKKNVKTIKTKKITSKKITKLKAKNPWIRAIPFLAPLAALIGAAACALSPAGGFLFSRGGADGGVLLNLLFYIIVTPVIRLSRHSGVSAACWIKWSTSYRLARLRLPRSSP